VVSGAHAPFLSEREIQMRRTILYTTGLMVAAGASLALAAPASASPACWGCSPYNTNLQSLTQTAVTNQTVLNNIGNPQIGVSLFGGGVSNFNGGGTAVAAASTYQSAAQLANAGGGWW
jgi:hypothetical protein